MADSSPTAALPSFTLGRYEHYKGRYYVAYGLARHSETAEWLVIYQTDYEARATDPNPVWGDHPEQLWVRPLSHFTELVQWPDGQERPRFALVV